MDPAVFARPTITIVEMYAAHCAVKAAIVSHTGPVGIVTDCATVLDTMRRRCLPKREPCRALALALRSLVDANGGSERIVFYKVKGHSGVRGNVMADKLARRGALGIQNE
jgi:ribonuclease HI